MLPPSTSSPNPVEEALRDLARLRQFAGTPAEFWPQFVAASARLVGANRGMLILSEAAQPERLKKLSEWSDDSPADRATMAFTRSLPEVVQNALASGSSYTGLDQGAATQSFCLGLKLTLQGTQNLCVVAFLLRNAEELQVPEAMVRLKLAADVPLTYLMNQQTLKTKVDSDTFAAVLDVMVLVNAETRFRAAALALCNGLASRFHCTRVSLGWLEQGYVRLQTMSRTERFDPRMAAVKSLEVVMEEALDQDDEILFPAPAGSSLITKDHEQFSRDQNRVNLASLPLRVEDQPVAVLTCERQECPFSEEELQQFRLACDQASRRLSELQRHDRWFGARWKNRAQERLTKVLGPENTWAKAGAVAGAGAAVILVLPIFNYRVEGNFILRSEEVTYLTAPYDSYIKSVEVRPGDLVEPNSPLLQLNTEDLELDEAAALAEMNRWTREAEKARAGRYLAEMRVAQAQADQAKARLDLTRYRLVQSQFKTPFRGVIIEGDLRQRLGAPVKQGDPLLKIASTEQLYVEAEINERDIHEIAEKGKGEMAFVSQPKLKFPIRIVRIEPSATPKEKMNVFVVRCAVDGKGQSWWRPGMSGVCKLSVERRTLLWIISHRTVDFLRMFFWW